MTTGNYLLPVFFVATYIFWLNQVSCETDTSEFPRDFLFGVASSAYQIEGGHDSDGKGENIWDYHLRLNPSLVRDSTNGNTACDSYNQYRQDLILLEELSVNFYRFSISWSRILPTGYSNTVNPSGLRYYNDLIDGLKSRNIEPMVTMYHWDLPKALQDIGGWANPLMADYFQDYSRVLFENFGDRIKYWITVNMNWAGYGDGQWPPLIDQPGIGEYLYFKGILMGHAKVYHLYSDEYKVLQKGEVGLTIDGRWYEPATDTRQDQEAAERAKQFTTGIIGNPVFGSGDYPQLVKDRVNNLSLTEGFSRSRLLPLTDAEKDYILGTFDFLGLNIYTTFLVKNGRHSDLDSVSFAKDLNVHMTQDPSWPKSNSAWLRSVPWGVRKVLNWVKVNYGNPPIFITENGFSDSGELEDHGRINYLSDYLTVILLAIHEDKVNIRGYAAWSLLDNFEWLSGYSERFGLHHVDFKDPNRKRTAKASAKWYKSLIDSKKIPETPSGIRDEL